MKKLAFLIVVIVTTINSSAFAKSSVDDKLKTKFIELDETIFNESFNRCRLEVLDPIIAENFEFYHDVAGFQDPRWLSQIS